MKNTEVRLENKPIKRGVFTNPLIVKLSKVHDTNSANSATYSGISAKVVWFLVCVIIGVVGFYLIGKNDTETMDFFSKTVSKTSLFTAMGGFGIMIIVPLLAFVFRPLIPILGSLFCAGTGFVVAFAGNVYGAEYKELIWLALIITIILVAIMAIIYSTGVVKVDKKFRTVALCLFLCAILLPVVTFILGLFPLTAPIATFVQNNLVNSILGSVIFVIIACMMLLADFNTIENLVENKMSKKYEWLAAFSLAYTVIWLYLKVLDLLAKMTDKNNE